MNNEHKGINEWVDQIICDDIEEVEFGKVLDGSNSHYEIRPTFAFGMSGKPYVTYGIFNAETGVMETETRQYPAAKEWVIALTAVLKGERPDTSMVVPMSDEDEEEDGQPELPLH